MCYGVKYKCTIDCVNDQVNTTLLSNGIVTGERIDEACILTCGAGEHFTDTMAMHYVGNPMPTSLFDLFTQLCIAYLPLIIIMLFGIIGIVLIYKYTGGSENDK